MPATKVNLSYMVDLAVGTPEIGAVNFNVLHSLLHAMLRRLNIVDVQADLNDFDRDSLLASKARELPVLNDVDSVSGQVDDAKDAITIAISERSSSMPALSLSTGMRTPYHLLEVKVAKMQEQLENITSLPSNEHLFEKTRTQYQEKPIGEMWLNMKLSSQVETNEKGISKCMSMIEDMTKERHRLIDEQEKQMDQIKGCMSMIEDMTKERHRLIDEQEKQMDQIKGLNVDDLMKRLNAMEESMNEMNDNFNILPPPDDFAKFVTGPELEDAVQGIRKDLESKLPFPHDFAQFVTWERLENALGIKQDWENLQQPTVIKMSSQTDDGSDPVTSRPTSSRSVTHVASPGPSGALLESLEKLGKVAESHEALTRQMEELEAEMEKKEDQGPLDGLNVSSELLEQPQELKKQVDAQAAAREKISEPSMALELLAPDPAPQPVTSNEDLADVVNDQLCDICNQNEPDRARNQADVVNDQPHDTCNQNEPDRARNQTDVVNDQLCDICNQNEPDRARNQTDVVNDQPHDTCNQNEPDRARNQTDVVNDQLCDTCNQNEPDKTRNQTDVVNDQLCDTCNQNEPDRARNQTDVVNDQLCDTCNQNEPDKTRNQTDVVNDQLCDICNQNEPDRARNQTDVVNDQLCDTCNQNEPDRARNQTDVVNDQLCDTCNQNEPDRARNQTDVVNDQLCDICNQNEPDRARNQADVVNDQLHDIRDDIITPDEELKEKSKVVESLCVQAKLEIVGTPLGRPKSADFKDTYHEALLKAQNANREEFKKLYAYCDELQMNKAERTEVDVKAVKRTWDDKENHSLFDTTTIDISKMIKEILEETWKQQCEVDSNDIDGKLDRSELDPLKECLLSKLNALNDKLKKQNQAPVEWVDDDAAGIRRQLIQKYNCISCDRPFDIVPTGSVPPSMPSMSRCQVLTPTISPRPYSTYEMDQIRQQAKNDTSFDQTVAERQKTNRCKSDQKAFQVHFGNDGEDFQKRRNDSNDYANADYYATNRSCGGQHTTTYPHHKRYAKLSHQSNSIFKENEKTNVYPLYKEEVHVRGADGNIYKGRRDRLVAKLPPVTQATQDPSSMQRIDKSTQQPMRPKVMPIARPSSAQMLHSPSPPPKYGSHPQSPHQTVSLQAMDGSAYTTPCPSPMSQGIISGEQAHQKDREINPES